jgi:DNA helicase-2/ATP-dependent DNA helicase PcrA
MVDLFHALRDSGVPASSIRCATFSKEAATTIETRAGVKGVFSTLHSLGYQICSEDGRKPVEPDLRFRLMCKLIRKYKLDYKELDSFISKMRRGNITPEESAENFEYGYSRAYGEYERERIAGGWMDFDSMLCDAVRLLEENENTRARWQFEYLIVDEAQDTDNLQWRMMQLLSQKHGNITVVGDPNQAIYTWRGASPDNLTNFTQWFPGGKYFYLGRNYRSTQNIVKFIRENAPPGCPQELLDKMVSARSEVGAPIGMKMYLTEDAEAEAAVANAQQDPLNSIIIARTNQMLMPLERICDENNIFYHLLGKSGFWKQSEIAKAVFLLKMYSTMSTKFAFAAMLPTLEAKYAVDDRTEKDNDALKNLQTLRVISEKFSSTAEFLTYANKKMHRRNVVKGLTISTVHQAKGGEWKNVFIIGARNGMMPHIKGDPREERRIYFVAISRAIDRLRLTFAGSPSPYLDRYLPEPVLDKLREKAGLVEKIQKQSRLFS